VKLSVANITATPLGFSKNLFPTWNNSGDGGSNITYNDVWYDASFSKFPARTTESGFDVTIPDALAQAAVNWFAFTGGADAYTGGGNFYIAPNPNTTGFEGLATPAASATPESGFYGILTSGLTGLLFVARRRLPA